MESLCYIFHRIDGAENGYSRRVPDAFAQTPVHTGLSSGPGKFDPVSVLALCLERWYNAAVLSPQVPAQCPIFLLVQSAVVRV